MATQTGSRITELDTISSFQSQAFEATHEGQPVLVIGSGSSPQASPCLQVMDRQGQINWVKQEEVTGQYETLLAQVRQSRGSVGQGGQSGR